MEGTMTDAGSPETAQGSVVIDEIIVVCKGCRGERRMKPKEPLVGAKAVIAWIEQGVPPCTCGATHCDIKLHMVEPN